MTKDEARSSIMGAISMALKDPTLQQGFEIICKENAELKKSCKIQVDTAFEMVYEKDEQLTKAKFLLKQLVDAFPKSYSDVVKDTLDEARKFVEE